MSGDMTKAYVADVRRRWSEEEKQAIIEESKTTPVARVAKRHGVATSLLFRWRKAEGIVVRRRSLRSEEQAEFVRVGLPAPIEAPRTRSEGVIEIVLSCGVKLMVEERTDLALVKRVIAALS